MKRRLYLTSLILAACALFMYCSNSGGEGVSSEVAKQFSQMPASVNGLAYVNMDQLRKSMFYEMITDSMEVHINENDEFRELVESTGFDFRRDIDEVFMGFDPVTPRNNEAVLMLVKGRFDGDKIVNYAKQKIAEHEGESELRQEAYQDYIIYSAGNGDKGLSFVGKNLVAVGSKPMLKSWLDNHAKGNATLSSALQAQMDHVKYRDGVWMTLRTGDVIDELVDDVRNDIQMGNLEALRSVEHVDFSMDLTREIRMAGQGHFVNSEKAELFHDAIKGAVAAAKFSASSDREMVDILNKLDIQTENKSVSFDFEMSRGELRKLMDRRRDFAMNDWH